MSKIIASLEALVVSALSIFAPIKTIMIVVLILILSDLVTGIMAAIKRKEPITSAALRRTVSKILAYELAIALGFVAQTYLMDGSIDVTKILSSLVGLVELKSCLENLNEVSGTDLLKSLIDKLGSTNQ